MKRILLLIIVLVAMNSFGAFDLNRSAPMNYDPSYVTTSKATYKGDVYWVVSMRRDGEHIKAKYFASPDLDGSSVPGRYQKWAKGRNIIGYCSGTYMIDSDYDGYYDDLDGLTIDNGIIVNRTLSPKFDGLVIVYATGGIVVSNLDDGDLTLKGGGVVESKKYNLRKSSELEIFKNWAVSQEATVFQTHLLVYRNTLDIYPNGDPNKRERRFLAVGTDDEGNTVHVIVQRPIGYETTLYEGARRTFEFLKQYKEMDITFMINLDTGGGDVCKLYNSNGSVNENIIGNKPIEDAMNLLVYYWE